MSRFRRRLMGLAALRQAAADDFVRVEYIENTSNAYINTLYRPSNNTSVEVKLKYIENLVQWKFVYGVEQPTYRFSFLKTYTGKPFRFDFGTTTNMFDYELVLNQLLIIKQDRNKLYIDDVLLAETSYSSTFRTPYNLYIFTCNQKGKVNDVYNNQQIRLYGFKILENNVLIRDYIPMYQISTDTYGLWDRVEKKFYTSPNGTAFTGGARVVEDANGKLYYIKNYITFAGSGKSLVSIGLKPNETDYYETKWYFAGSGRSNFMGARTKSNNNDYQCYGYSKSLHITYDTGNIVNYSVTYTNKAYIFKTYFNKKTNQMYGAIYDANKRILAQNKVAKRSGAASVDFFIGKQNGLNNYYPPVNSRMYYFKYWRNHTLVRDMIPVQSVETGEYGFFDKVNLKIYYSSGSADFTGA